MLPVFGITASELVVIQKTGETFRVSLTKEPKMSFSKTTITIEGKDVTMMFPMENVKGFNIVENESPSLISPQIEDECRYDIQNGKVYFYNIKSTKEVHVYNTKGVIIKEYKLSNDGSGVLDLIECPKGILIVKAGKISFKITHK